MQGVPVIQTGVNFTNLGKLTLTFADGKDGASVTCDVEVLDYAAAMSYTPTEAGEQKAEEVKDKLDEIELQQAKILDEVLCKLDHPLFGGYVCYKYVESRIVETSYGDFVADAFKYYAEKFAANEKLDLPVVAVENGGGIAQSLPTWYYNGTDVTVGDVLSAFNHGNLVEVLKVSPAELFAAIEQGLVMTGQDDDGLLLCAKPSGSFLQCSGFSYTYDPAGEDGKKVTEVRLADGTTLDRNDEENQLLLATNNYVSASFKKGEKLGELGGEDVLIKDYILYLSGQNDGVLDYDCNYDRVKIANDRSPETYTVKLAVKKGAGAAAQPQINKTYALLIDGTKEVQVTTDAEGYITLELTKGAHYLRLSVGSNFVYVNNYSGTGVEEGDYTKDGYYTFAFLISEEE